MTPKELGFPVIGKTSEIKEGKFIAWIPGMKVDVFDWHLLVWHGSNIRRYLGKGGDPSKVIIHFLAFDGGTIEPMWGRDTFKARCQMLRDWGFDKIVAPDFSSWADFPVVLQLHNYYRSARVTQDLIIAGFDVIPNICWSHPACDDASFGMWEGERPFILIDGNHWGRNKVEKRLFIRGMNRMAKEFPDSRFLLYTGSKYIARLSKQILPNCFIVGSRAISVGWSSKRAKTISQA